MAGEGYVHFMSFLSGINKTNVSKTSLIGIFNSNFSLFF